MLKKMSNAEKQKVISRHPLYNRNIGHTFTDAQRDAVGRYIAAHSHINSIRDRHVYVLMRANGTYARFFIGGGLNRRESDQKMVLDLSNAFEISYIIGVLSDLKLVKNQGVELVSYGNGPKSPVERAMDTCAWFNDSVEDIVLNERNLHVADAHGVIYLQNRYANFREFYPQERPL
jgi:hypothetical protein